MFRSVCILLVPLGLLLTSCDNNTQEDGRWDEIYKDFASGAKVQPWTDAQRNSSNADNEKNWN